MRLLDLFCGAGGAAMGYHQAGFAEIVGVDHAPQKHYPFQFVHADALEYLAAHGHEFNAIHASPPCQGYSVLKHFARGELALLVPATRTLLRHIGKPYVIENVVGAPIDTMLMLCGTMFGLCTPCGAELRRHRLFESSIMLMSPGPCQHGRVTICVTGHAFRNEAQSMRRRGRTITVTGSTPQHNVVRGAVRETYAVAEARMAMGIDWMVMKELSQAIPPAYTKYIGEQLVARIL